MKNYIVVFSMFAALVAGCGRAVDACPDESCSMESEAQSSLCCWCANPPPGCSEEEPPPQPTTTKFAVGMWNAASETRVCTLSYTFKNIDNVSSTGSLVAGESLPSEYWRGGIVQARTGTTVTMTATCQHPNYPATNVRATRTITTLPMDRERTCRAIYREAPTPAMTIPCWEGPVVGQVPGIEFVTAVRNDSAYTATVGFGYFPAIDGGGQSGTEVRTLNSISLGSSLQARTSVFAPLDGVVKAHLTATINGTTREMYADVAMDDPGAVLVLTIHADGSLSFGKSNF